VYVYLQYSTGLGITRGSQDIAVHPVFICWNSPLSVVPTQPCRHQTL